MVELEFLFHKMKKKSVVAATEIEDPWRYTEYQRSGGQLFHIHCLNPADYHAFDDKPFQEEQRRHTDWQANVLHQTQKTLPPKTTKQYIDKIRSGMRSLGNAENV